MSITKNTCTRSQTHSFSRGACVCESSVLIVCIWFSQVLRDCLQCCPLLYSASVCVIWGVCCCFAVSLAFSCSPSVWPLPHEPQQLLVDGGIGAVPSAPRGRAAMIGHGRAGGVVAHLYLSARAVALVPVATSWPEPAPLLSCSACLHSTCVCVCATSIPLWCELAPGLRAQTNFFKTAVPHLQRRSRTQKS
jgi:hypothetical protein